MTYIKVWYKKSKDEKGKYNKKKYTSRLEAEKKVKYYQDKKYLSSWVLYS